MTRSMGVEVKEKRRGREGNRGKELERQRRERFESAGIPHAS